MKEKENYQKNLEEKLNIALEKERRSFTGFFIRNYRFTYLIILAIFLGGLYNVFTLPREADPEVKIPYATVSTVYPGATPTDMEELVTNKIEEKIKNLDELKDFTSRSGQGFSSIFVKFNAEADLQDSFQKLRDEVDKAKPELPDEANEPIVAEIRINDVPIVTYSLLCENENCQLKKYADLIQNKLESIKDVSKVEIVGGTEREFQIIVNQVKLASFNLSLGQIVSAIARTNFNLPAGDIEIDGFKYNVRVQGKFEDPESLNNIVIATYNDAPVYISDVAQVIDGTKDKKTKSKIGLPDTDAKDTISLDLYKKTGGNILNIVDESNKLVKELANNKDVPSDLKIVKTADNASYIRESINTLGRSGIQTMILIVVLLFIVLGLRGALITGLSVPIAFLMAFIFLGVQDLTLNNIVLYSLVISLGLMVDNSIIIMEGINEYITKHHRPPLEAAILSVWNFKWPIISGTLTTVSAFLPMLLVSGILGEYFSFIPRTITITLLSSLFVALIVIPMLSAKYIKIENNNNGNINKNNGNKHRKAGTRYHLLASKVEKIKDKYETLMRYLLHSNKRRRLFLATCWIVFVMAVAVPVLGLMKIQMFPSVDWETFWVTVEMPVGTILENTGQKTSEVERIVAQIPELKSYVTSLGTKISVQGNSSSGSHLATVAVNLVPKSDRKRKSQDIITEVRAKLKKIEGAKIEIEDVSAGPPTGAPIDVRIYGEDTKELATLSKKIINILEKIPGTVNVDDSIENATGEFTFKINKQRTNYYGLDIVTVASTIRNALYGTKASSVTIDGEDIDITVKYDKAKFTNVNDLEDLLIFTPTGTNIQLKQIATLALEPSLLSINHKGGKQIVNVTSNLEEKANLQKILTEFNGKKKELNIPEGYSIEVGGEVEDIQQSYNETFYSMFIAIILIAFILVLQFNSFRQPFIILTALPLAVIGVIFGLNILRMPFSFPAFLGVVSLAGIAVNDAIVLIDRINKNCENGLSLDESIIEGGRARMQPIFLTSVTTISGVFPLLFADEIWRGFSTAVIFGLSFSTILTLVVVPLYFKGFTKKDRFRCQAK